MLCAKKCSKNQNVAKCIGYRSIWCSNWTLMFDICGHHIRRWHLNDSSSQSVSKENFNFAKWPKSLCRKCCNNCQYACFSCIYRVELIHKFVSILLISFFEHSTVLKNWKIKLCESLCLWWGVGMSGCDGEGRLMKKWLILLRHWEGNFPAGGGGTFDKSGKGCLL